MRHSNVQSPPRTIMEVYKSLPEGTLAELIDGVIYMSPSPSAQHQRVLLKLAKTLSDYAERLSLGEVFIAPLDVYFDQTANAIQPDILFISDKGSAKVLANSVSGPPDLVIELVSPANSEHDWKRKKSLYERFGVKEYWVVDPQSKETTGFLLKDGIYHPLENGFGQLHSSILGHSFTF